MVAVMLSPTWSAVSGYCGVVANVVDDGCCVVFGGHDQRGLRTYLGRPGVNKAQMIAVVSSPTWPAVATVVLSSTWLMMVAV